MLLEVRHDGDVVGTVAHEGVGEVGIGDAPLAVLAGCLGDATGVRVGHVTETGAAPQDHVRGACERVSDQEDAALFEQRFDMGKGGRDRAQRDEAHGTGWLPIAATLPHKARSSDPEKADESPLAAAFFAFP